MTGSVHREFLLTFLPLKGSSFFARCKLWSILDTMPSAESLDQPKALIIQRKGKREFIDLQKIVHLIQTMEVIEINVEIAIFEEMTPKEQCSILGKLYLRDSRLLCAIKILDPYDILETHHDIS